MSRITRASDLVPRLVAGCAALALACSNTMAASECFSPPPSAAGGDMHAAVEPSTLSASQHRTAGTLLARLDGRWRGTATGYFCEGSTGAARERRDDHAVELEVDVDSGGEAVLRADLTSTTGGSSRTETLRLFLRDDRLRDARDDPAGDVRILELAAGRLEYHHKQGIAGSGNFVEVKRRISVSGSTLRIDHRVYSQGGLGAASEWVLRRR